MSSDFSGWLECRQGIPEEPPLLEVLSSNRYSVEINYRTTLAEINDAAARLLLGYISAGLKNCNYHVKLVFRDKPFRLFVSTRNWDDGEWVGVVTWHEPEHCFVIGKGVYHKDRKTVAMVASRHCTAQSAAEMVKEMRSYLEHLKREKPPSSDTLEPAQLRRGPKPSLMKKLKKPTPPWKPRAH